MSNDPMVTESGKWEEECSSPSCGHTQGHWDAGVGPLWLGQQRSRLGWEVHSMPTACGWRGRATLRGSPCTCSLPTAVRQARTKAGP